MFAQSCKLCLGYRRWCDFKRDVPRRRKVSESVLSPHLFDFTLAAQEGAPIGKEPLGRGAGMSFTGSCLLCEEYNYCALYGRLKISFDILSICSESLGLQAAASVHARRRWLFLERAAPSQALRAERSSQLSNAKGALPAYPYCEKQAGAHVDLAHNPGETTK